MSKRRHLPDPDRADLALCGAALEPGDPDHRLSACKACLKAHGTKQSPRRPGAVHFTAHNQIQ